MSVFKIKAEHIILFQVFPSAVSGEIKFDKLINYVLLKLA
jgi:hypothetical protein